MTNNEIKTINTKLKQFKIKLQEKVENSNQIFIVTHKHADLDAIASAIGISLIAKKLKRKSYIIIDDKVENSNSEVLSIIDDIANYFDIITTNMYREIKGDNDTLIITDANKGTQICCNDYLDEFKNIIIIDHHSQNSKTVATATKFIEPRLSSTCEIITSLLHQFNINYNEHIANYLLAGIILDTNKLRSETSTQKTFETVSKLLSKGADINYAYELLDESYETKMRVNDLIRETDFYNYSGAICYGKNEDVYKKEEIAKAANALLEFKADINCVIGRIDEETIAISSRSNGKINVNKVMETFGGGGDIFRGAAQIKGTDTEIVAKKLIKILKPNFYNNSEEEKNEKS